MFNGSPGWWTVLDGVLLNGCPKCVKSAKPGDRRQENGAKTSKHIVQTRCPKWACKVSRMGKPAVAGVDGFAPPCGSRECGREKYGTGKHHVQRVSKSSEWLSKMVAGGIPMGAPVVKPALWIYSIKVKTAESRPGDRRSREWAILKLAHWCLPQLRDPECRYGICSRSLYSLGIDCPKWG